MTADLLREVSLKDVFASCWILQVIRRFSVNR